MGSKLPRGPHYGIENMSIILKGVISTFIGVKFILKKIEIKSQIQNLYSGN